MKIDREIEEYEIAGEAFIKQRLLEEAEAREDREKAPGFVQRRMIEAFATLRRIPTNMGPKAYGSNWPLVLHALEMIGGEAVWTFHQQEQAREIKQPLTSDQVTRMEESLHWPSRYLSNYAMGADALNTWAMCIASHKSIEALMRERARQAVAIAKRIERQVNENHASELLSAASEVSRWARRQYADKAPSEDRLERIIHNAKIRLARELQKRGKAHMTIFVKPSECSPDKAISADTLSRHKNAACLIISNALNGKIKR